MELATGSNERYFAATQRNISLHDYCSCSKANSMFLEHLKRSLILFLKFFFFLKECRRGETDLYSSHGLYPECGEYNYYHLCV